MLRGPASLQNVLPIVPISRCRIAQHDEAFSLGCASNHRILIPEIQDPSNAESHPVVAIPLRLSGKLHYKYGRHGCICTEPAAGEWTRPWKDLYNPTSNVQRLLVESTENDPPATSMVCLCQCSMWTSSWLRWTKTARPSQPAQDCWSTFGLTRHLGTANDRSRVFSKLVSQL
jgi:hypothetical protein